MPAMANVATLLASRHRGLQHPAPQDFAISQAELNSLLEGATNYYEVFCVHC